MAVHTKIAWNIVNLIAGFTDRAASVELERQLKKLVALRMAGTGPDAELSRFLESCPVSVRGRLAEWNVIRMERAAAGKPLSDHAAEWKTALSAKGSSKEYQPIVKDLTYLLVASHKEVVIEN